MTPAYWPAETQLPRIINEPDFIHLSSTSKTGRKIVQKNKQTKTNKQTNKNNHILEIEPTKNLYIGSVQIQLNPLTPFHPYKNWGLG